MVPDLVYRVDRTQCNAFMNLPFWQQQSLYVLITPCKEHSETSWSASEIGKNDGISMFEAKGIDVNVSYIIIFKNLNIHCIF